MTGSRKFVTTGIGFTFVVVGVTGLIFQFFFKNHALEGIHGWLGTALVAIAVAHVVQNWKPLRNHFRDRRVFALLVPLVLVIGLFAFQSQGRSPQAGPGRGPDSRELLRKMGQANVHELAPAFGKTSESVAAAMSRDGVEPGRADETVQQLADRSRMSPERILSYFAN